MTYVREVTVCGKVGVLGRGEVMDSMGEENVFFIYDHILFVCFVSMGGMGSLPLHPPNLIPSHPVV